MNSQGNSYFARHKQTIKHKQNHFHINSDLLNHDLLAQKIVAEKSGSSERAPDMISHSISV